MPLERLILWIAFNVFVLGMLAIDLGVFHRKAHAVSIKEASIWSTVWILLALVFNLGIYFVWGQEKALEFLTGYVIEKSLSVDNLFVFLMIFQYFATPAIYQHRVLFWGIVGALVMRAIFIATGAALLQNFHWMIYIFGGFLIVTGIKMLLQGDEKLEPDKNPVVRLFQRWVPIINEYQGQRFFVRKDGKVQATLLMLVLVVVETTDVIFAVDSIPAIFAITTDPFIVYTSNVFAILGLRALYFMLAGVMQMFVYLKVGLSFVLCFVGAKMLIVDFYKIPIGISLGTVAGILILSVAASLLVRWKETGVLSSRLGLEKFAAQKTRHRLNPIAIPVYTKVGALILLVAAALGIAKCDSITSGPSGDDAIVAIRVVQRELAEAQQVHGQSQALKLYGANATLDEAWFKLGEKRYAEAISAAQKARALLSTLSPVSER
ncbi:MAG TPA: TerC family protein [Candidatus Binatia bacterium]|nr:TerC family protein [Candidatus Binatia bacterium]